MKKTLPKLVELADQLDSKGLTKEADEVDSIIEKATGMEEKFKRAALSLERHKESLKAQLGSLNTSSKILAELEKTYKEGGVEKGKMTVKQIEDFLETC